MDPEGAFLQAGADLEQEKLTVWGPLELNVMIGGTANEPKALRVRKALYGHGPRTSCLVSIRGECSADRRMDGAYL